MIVELIRPVEWYRRSIQNGFQDFAPAPVVSGLSLTSAEKTLTDMSILPVKMTSFDGNLVGAILGQSDTSRGKTGIAHTPERTNCAAVISATWPRSGTSLRPLKLARCTTRASPFLPPITSFDPSGAIAMTSAPPFSWILSEELEIGKVTLVGETSSELHEILKAGC